MVAELKSHHGAGRTVVAVHVSSEAQVASTRTTMTFYVPLCGGDHGSRCGVDCCDLWWWCRLC